MEDTKHCRICNCVKPLTEFYQWPNKKIKVSAYCKPCTKKRVKEREAAKPEQYKAMHRAHREKNKEKLSAYQAARRAKPEEREKARQRTAQWRIDNPEREHDNHVKKHYGLPKGSYKSMFEAQEGKCFLCGTDTPGGRGRFHIDHCHSTGSVRKLLCHSCNLMLGHSKDDPALLRRAADYVEGGG